MENESNSNTTVFQGDDEVPSYSVGLECLAPKATNNNDGEARHYQSTKCRKFCQSDSPKVPRKLQTGQLEPS